jgi:hypothetical protein
MTTVTRYVPTYINKDGAHCLMRAAQGRDTFETAEDAQRWLDAVLSNPHNSPDTLTELWGDLSKCEVRAWACYPNHFDPTHTLEGEQTP